MGWWVRQTLGARPWGESTHHHNPSIEYAMPIDELRDYVQSGILDLSVNSNVCCVINYEYDARGDPAARGRVPPHASNAAKKFCARYSPAGTSHPLAPSPLGGGTKRNRGKPR